MSLRNFSRSRMKKECRRDRRLTLVASGRGQVKGGRRRAGGGGRGKRLDIDIKGSMDSIDSIIFVQYLSVQLTLSRPLMTREN
jgi:hypothetical protein